MSIWFLKIVGAVLLLSSAWLTGQIFAARRKAISRQISGFLRLFRALRSGISYHRAPIGEILSHVEREVAEACSGRDEAVRGGSLAEWVAACDILSVGLSRLLSRAVTELGRGYREEQIAVCDRYIEALEAQYRESVNRHREQVGLINTLFLSLAAGAVILLL